MIMKPILRHLLLQLPNLHHIGIIPNLPNFKLEKSHLFGRSSRDSSLHTLASFINMSDNFLLELRIFVYLFCQSWLEGGDGLLLLDDDFG